MPTVKVYKEKLMTALGESYTDEEFDHLCFAFGIELDDVTSDKEIVTKAKGEEAAEGMSDDVVYKIDVPANRYDLLCLEGIVRSLRVFLGKEEQPKFVINTPDDVNIIKITQKPSTKGIRQFVVGAVLRDVTFDQDRYNNFMDLQDKIHQNIGRERTLIAIGTHDLDTITAPFTYDALPKSSIKFRPLAEEKVFAVDELFEYYHNKAQCHLKPYLHITENHPVQPVILDSSEIVLSLPPIINGEHSKIKLTTKNVFIECTGTDFTKLNIALNIMVSTFSQYCAVPFSVERVQVVDEETKKVSIFPDLSHRVFTASVKYVNNITGIPNMPGTEMASILGKMSLPTVFDGETGLLQVNCPVTRPDILHACDIAEDVAIAYGYNKLERTMPKTMTIGREQPLNQLTDLNRGVLAECGYNEVLTWILTSHEDNFVNLNKEPSNNAVVLANSSDFGEVRTSLLSGLLKVIKYSMGHVTLPIRVFELGDVVTLDSKMEVGAKNNRRIGAMYTATNSGFEEIWSVADRIMTQNNCSFVAADSPEALAADAEPYPTTLGKTSIYYIRPSEHVTFFPGRRADVFFNGYKIGQFGVLHPNVLAHYSITFPCSALELDLERIL